jgi:hypothetical protein
MVGERRMQVVGERRMQWSLISEVMMEAISGDQFHSVVISGNQWQSVAIIANQRQSVAISGAHLGGHEARELRI